MMRRYGLEFSANLEHPHHKLKPLFSMSAAHTSKDRKTIAALCCGAHIVQDGLTAAVYVLLPILAQAFGLTYAQVGLVRAAHMSSMAILELPSGIMAEWVGERSLLAFGLVCAGVGYFSLSLADGINAVMLAFVIAGVGTAFQHSLASSLISTTYPDKGRRSALGLYNSSGDAGKLAFTGLFSVLLGLGLGWQTIVTGYGWCAIVSGVLIYIILRRLKAGVRVESATATGGGMGWLDWGIKNRLAFSALIVAVFLDTAVQSGFFTFITFFVADRDVPVNYAAFAIVATLLGGIFGKASCGFLADRFGVKLSFALVQIATAALIGVLLVVPAFAIFLLLPLLGMFLQGSTSITYGAVNDYVRNERKSRGFALIYSTSTFSAIGGPVLLGLTGDLFGLDATMVAMAIISLAAILPVIWFQTEGEVALSR